jgi:hypothetical protein
MCAGVDQVQVANAFSNRQLIVQHFTCQHMSAYVSIRQHTSAYVRQHTSANVCLTLLLYEA